jgi:hypothetical protein
MNVEFFENIEGALHTERLDAYRRDGADTGVTLARYSLNMALSEALYPTLQYAEIALRNGIHAALARRHCTVAWYDAITGLPAWQMERIGEAKSSLVKNGKPITPGQMVAELNFGFWTGFFNKLHARNGIGHFLAKTVFVHAPKHERDLAKLDLRWKEIRVLRNRVFHHERILHWNDLDARQQAILEVIWWISPELQQLAATFDRYPGIRSGGLSPWLRRLESRWP